MVILGVKFLVWCSLIVLFVGSVFGVSFTFSEIGVTVTISDYEGVLKCGCDYLISVSGPSGYGCGSIRFGMPHGNAYFLLPAPGLAVGGSGYYTLNYGRDGGVCEVRSISTVSAEYYSGGAYSRVVDLNGSVTVVSDSCTGYADPPGPPVYVDCSVVGDGSVMVVGEVEVATPDYPRSYTVEMGDSICFVAIPGNGYVFNAYSVDGGDWIFEDNDFCLNVLDDMDVEFRFVDALSFDDDDCTQRSEWWGTYEATSTDSPFSVWKVKGQTVATIGESGFVYDAGVYTMFGSWQDHLNSGEGGVYIFSPSWSERFWVYKEGKHIGHVNEDNEIVLGATSDVILGDFVEDEDWWGGSEPSYGFSGWNGLVEGPVYAIDEVTTGFFFIDEWGKRVLAVKDRFWSGEWDYPGFDPASPTTYPPEPFWKADPPEYSDDEDANWLTDTLKGFFEKYFKPSSEITELMADELRNKAASKFPFCLFWVPGKLAGDWDDVTVAPLDLSMFFPDGSGDDLKVDFYNNENMDEVAEFTRSASRFMIWILFVAYLREIITPLMVID